MSLTTALKVWKPAIVENPLEYLPRPFNERAIYLRTAATFAAALPLAILALPPQTAFSPLRTAGLSVGILSLALGGLGYAKTVKKYSREITVIAIAAAIPFQHSMSVASAFVVASFVLRLEVFRAREAVVDAVVKEFNDKDQVSHVLMYQVALRPLIVRSLIRSCPNITRKTSTLNHTLLQHIVRQVLATESDTEIQAYLKSFKLLIDHMVVGKERISEEDWRFMMDRVHMQKLSLFCGYALDKYVAPANAENPRLPEF